MNSRSVNSYIGTQSTASGKAGAQRLFARPSLGLAGDCSQQSWLQLLLARDRIKTNWHLAALQPPSWTPGYWWLVPLQSLGCWLQQPGYVSHQHSGWGSRSIACTIRASHGMILRNRGARQPLAGSSHTLCAA